jgi:hypothetical protein
MKILKEGDEKIGKWWVGKIIDCKKCGRKIELELKDCKISNWCQLISGNIQFYCDMCGNMIELKFESTNQISIK